MTADNTLTLLKKEIGIGQYQRLRLMPSMHMSESTPVHTSETVRDITTSEDGFDACLLFSADIMKSIPDSLKQYPDVLLGRPRDPPAGLSIHATV